MLGESSLGAVLVAQSGGGLCAVLLGDRSDELVADVRKRFARVDVVPADPPNRQLLSEVIACIEDPSRSADIVVDLRGTPFQRQVWEELRKIGPGRTSSYGEIARRMGAPKSSRAVAGAIAANPIAVIVPCHRVVRADGSLSGYRWGTRRKQALLDREQCR